MTDATKKRKSFKPRNVRDGTLLERWIRPRSVANIAEKPPVKLREHNYKVHPSVKVRVPRTHSDQESRPGQWIHGSSDALEAVGRQSKENKGLMMSQLRNLLLRGHKGSNWARIPDFGSSACTDKCYALLILTLNEVEMVGSKQGL